MKANLPYPVMRDGELLGYAPPEDDYDRIVIATPAHQAGHRVGLAIARDTLADGLSPCWTGLDPQDADQLTAAGFEPGTDDWDVATAAAEIAFRHALVR